MKPEPEPEQAAIWLVRDAKEHPTNCGAIMQSVADLLDRVGADPLDITLTVGNVRVTVRVEQLAPK